MAEPAVERTLFEGSAFYFGQKTPTESSERAKSLLPAGTRASQVAINDSHSALITLDARQLLVWGSAQYGRLGDSAPHQDQPTDGGGGGDETGGQAHVPRPVASLAQHRVRKVALGPHHTLALLANGELYAFGTNECCQLGTGGERTMTNTVPRRLDALQRERVTDVSVGYSTNLALTADGKVFSFGEGYGGGLGHGDEEDQPVPKLLAGLQGKFIVAVAAGFYDHNLALAGDGTVYSFGGCKYGELGHGVDQMEATTPRAIEALRGVHIVAIAAGDYHCLALSDTGDVYSWGLGKAGQLGHGDRASQSAPKRVDALGGICIEQIAAGENHSLALADDGRLFGFGRANVGQLGAAQTPAALPVANAAMGEKGLQKRELREATSSGTSKHEAASTGVNKRHTLPVLIDAGLGRLPIARIAAFRKTSVVFT